MHVHRQIPARHGIRLALDDESRGGSVVDRPKRITLVDSLLIEEGMIVGPQLSEDLRPGGLRVEPQLYGFLVGSQADLRLPRSVDVDSPTAEPSAGRSLPFPDSGPMSTSDLARLEGRG